MVLSIDMVSHDPKPPYSSLKSSAVATFTTLKFWPFGLTAVCDRTTLADSVVGQDFLRIMLSLFLMILN